jgi:hypothetical protein
MDFLHSENTLVKRIKLEYARLFLGSLQLGLLVTAPRDVMPQIAVPFCHHHMRSLVEDLKPFGELPFAWRIPKTQITVKLKSIKR